MPYLPINKLIFYFIYLGLTWLGIWLVFIILLFLLFQNLIIITKPAIIPPSQIDDSFLFTVSSFLFMFLILGILSICCPCWKIGDQLLISLMLNLLGRLLLFSHLILQSILLIYLYYALIISTFSLVSCSYFHSCIL